MSDSEKDESMKQKRKTNIRKSVRGKKTPQHEFRRPILQVLKRLNNTAPRIVVLKNVEKLLKDKLTQYDKSDIKTGAIRWERSAEFEIRVMREEGILKPVNETERGIWSLTEIGQKLAESD